MNANHAYETLKQTVNEWLADKAMRLGAALAYYSVFSIAPLVIIAIAISSFVFGEQAAQGEIVQQIQGMVGESGARAIEDMLASNKERGSGGLATAFGVVALLFGASGVFGQLQDALNTIWKVEPKPGRGVLGVIKDRFFSFTMVLGTGFLLLVSLIVTAALEAITKFIAGDAGVPLQIVNTVFSMAFVMLLFALIFKYVPDIKIEWRDVWIGAALTALLFTVGKYLIGLYLGQASVTSSYGAAGSLVVLLLWVYYSSLILLFGAEFTRVHASKSGHRVPPSDNAIEIRCESLARQGAPIREQGTQLENVPSAR